MATDAPSPVDAPQELFLAAPGGSPQLDWIKLPAVAHVAKSLAEQLGIMSVFGDGHRDAVLKWQRFIRLEHLANFRRLPFDEFSRLRLSGPADVAQGMGLIRDVVCAILQENGWQYICGSRATAEDGGVGSFKRIRPNPAYAEQLRLGAGMILRHDEAVGGGTLLANRRAAACVKQVDEGAATLDTQAPQPKAEHETPRQINGFDEKGVYWFAGRPRDLTTKATKLAKLIYRQPGTVREVGGEAKIVRTAIYAEAVREVTGRTRLSKDAERAVRNAANDFHNAVGSAARISVRIPKGIVTLTETIAE